MSQHRELNTGDILPSGFLDAMQEYLGVGVFNFLLAKATADPATAVKLTTGTGGTPGVGNDQVSIAIMGQWRYRRSAVTASVPGGLAVGTHDIYVTAPALNTAAEDAGTFNYDFALELRAAGSLPTTAIYRKVGEFVWDGSKITTIKQTVGVVTSAQGAASGDLSGEYPGPVVGPFAAGKVLSWAGDTFLDRAAAGRLRTTGLFLASTLAGNVLQPYSASRGYLSVAGGADASINAVAGRVEVLDRLSVSSGHAYGAFPDPGAGGIYAAGAATIAGALSVGTYVYGRVAAFAQTADPAAGYIGMFAGTTNNAGYLAWFQPNGLRQGYMGFGANGAGVNYVAEQGPFTVNSNRLSVSTRGEQHTWAPGGDIKVASGAQDFIPAMFAYVRPGETLTAVWWRSKIKSGTSVTFDIRRRTWAGAEFTLASGLVATTSNSQGSLATGLADGDELYPVVTAVNGIPKGWQLTVALDRTASA